MKREKLQAFRKEKDLTQKQMARELDITVFFTLSICF